MTVRGGAAVFDPFAWWAAAGPDRTALVEPRHDRRWSYAQADEAIARWVGWLRANGMGPGDRLAILASNRSEQLFLTLACGRLGLLVAPLNWRLASAELAPILRQFNPTLLIGETGLHPLARDAEVGDRWRDLDLDVVPAVAGAEPTHASHHVAADDGWIVLFTSGTTGAPKGAILPHRQVFWNAFATATGWGLGSDEVVPVSTPLFHTGGLNVLAAPVWQRGGTVVLLERFDPAEFLAVLERERCTLAFAVPTQFVMLTELPAWSQRLPSLRLVVSGGAACPPALAARIAAPGYAFREGFGLTEFGPNCFTGSDRALHGESGTVGLPLPLVEAEIRDEAGAALSRGTVGELWLRGPMAFAGYLDDPSRTAETLVEGWVRTGDLFVQDDAGEFAVRGRRKEMFISGGENVFPAEVEAVLAMHPDVAEVSVVGVADARWGEVGRAFVVSRNAALSSEAVLGHARERLAAYKVPKQVTFLESLPRLGSGKCDRARLAHWEEPA